MLVPKKNIFEYDGEEFNKKLDEIFSNTDKKELKQILIECGLEVKERNTIEKTADEMFEELGYRKQEKYSGFLYTNNMGFNIKISNLGLVTLYYEDEKDEADGFIQLTDLEVEAINKKIKEMEELYG